MILGFVRYISELKRSRFLFEVLSDSVYEDGRNGMSLLLVYPYRYARPDTVSRPLGAIRSARNLALVPRGENEPKTIFAALKLYKYCFCVIFFLLYTVREIDLSSYINLLQYCTNGTFRCCVLYNH